VLVKVGDLTATHSITASCVFISGFPGVDLSVLS
jgi:hypothetical protein